MSKLKTLKLYAKAMARHPFKKHKRRAFIETHAAVRHFTELDRGPLVSVLIVSYNSREDLASCLTSLNRQSYSRTEIVIVENGDLDAADLVQSLRPDAKYVRAPKNLGFAEGNNFALRFVTGEYVLLVNPDARLEEDCLYELLCAIGEDESTAVAVPKLRFWTRFVDVEARRRQAFEIDASALADQLSYKKLFVRNGKRSKDGTRISSVKSTAAAGYEGHHIVLRLPVDGSTLRMPTLAPNRLAWFGGGREIATTAGEETVAISLLPSHRPAAFWVINNAGSGIRKGRPYDIGFGQADTGRYDSRNFAEAFCGCVALIKRTFVIEHQLFRPEFFAYFEDSELSFRLGRAGLKIAYAPRAIAFHRHSAAFAEESLLWTALVHRSGLLYNFHCGAKNGNAALRLFLGDERRYDKLPPALASTLRDLDRLIGAQEPRRRRIGVYNSWWNTLGGGELHALCMLRELAQDGDEIFLISETEFDKDELFHRFHFELENCGKLIVASMTPELTTHFDVFINATYCSGLVSKARNSFYLVSFPHKGLSAAAKNSYYFLFNSSFTKMWADRIWGAVRGEIIYPIHSLSVIGADKIAKEKIVITVGRITRSGHAKNPDAIIKAFIQAKKKARQDGWRLCVVGNVDASKPEDIDFLHDLKRAAAEGETIQILANCPKSELDILLAKAAIYVHAAGLNQPADAPEKHEHFGISVLEACMRGCCPIVYKVGGPAELIKTLGVGSVYADEAELARVLTEHMYSEVCHAEPTVEAAHRFVAENAGLAREVFARASAPRAARLPAIPNSVVSRRPAAPEPRHAQ